MCRELLTVGYMDIKKKMDNGDVPLGNIVPAVNCKMIKVGPVVDFITTDEKLEKLLCANQKAIHLVTKWRTADDFVQSWNELFGEDNNNSNTTSSNRRTIVLRNIYSSVDHGYDDKYSRAETEFRVLNENTIKSMWIKAAERVEALKRIDALKGELLKEVRKNISGKCHNGRGLKRDNRDLEGKGDKDHYSCTGTIKRRFFY